MPLTEASHPNAQPGSSKHPSRISSFSTPTSSFLLPPHPLSTSRYHRQLLVPSISVRGQEAISKAKVLIVGLGGLGSPASLYLAAAGIGTLGLIDADTVEVSNLHRQIVHSEATVGAGKVESALQRLRALNSGIRYVGYGRAAFGARGNAVAVVAGRGMSGEGEGEGEGEGGEVVPGGGYDVVLDCTDNPATRYLISDVCVALGRVLVSGAAQRAEGQLMRLNYPPRGSGPEDVGVEHGRGEVGTKGPCYRCVFPTPPAPETVQSCSEIGILGPVVGVIGTLMAMEALRIITATETGTVEDGWRPNLLLYNALAPDPRGMFRSVGLRRAARRDCLACGDETVLRAMNREKITGESIENGTLDYGAFCGRVEDVKVLKAESRVSADDFVQRMTERDADGGDVKSAVVVVDVREEIEYELGAKVKNSINVPISKILRHGHGHSQLGDQAESLDQLLGSDSSRQEEGHDDDEEPIYFLCQRGNDSQIAAKKFLDAVDAGTLRSKGRWIGDVEGGFEALQRYRREQ